MANDSASPQIQIGVLLNANTASGADQAIGDIERLKAAESSAAASTDAATAAETRAAEIMREYSATAQEAARALELLGPSASTAAIGSNELGSAVLQARSEIGALAAQIAETYGSTLAEANRVVESFGAENARAAIGSNELGQAVLAARSELIALSAAATQEAAAQAAADAEVARGAEIMREYSLTAQEAARALELLGPSANTAAIGSAELEAAVEAAQRETAALAATQERSAAIAAEYNTSLNVVARAMELLGPASQTAAIGSAELEAALEAANAEIAAGNSAWRERLALMRQSAAAEMEALEAEDAAASGGKTLAGVSDTVAAAMARLGISQAEVTATAQKMSASLDVAARAMIQMKNAELATEVARVRVELEALTAPSADVVEAQQAIGEEAERAGAKGANSFGRGSPFFHAMVASNNISRGGAMELRGIFEAVELASFVLPGLIGPMLLLGATIGEIIHRHEEFGDKGKKAIDDVKDEWSVASGAFASSLKTLGDDKTFPTLLGDAKKFSEELHFQETALQTIQAALDRLEDAKFGAQEALLNRREQFDLQGKSGEDAEKIRLSYDQQRDDLRARHDRDKAARELSAKEAALIDLQSQLSAKDAEVAAARADVAKAIASTKAGSTGASLGQSDYQFARDTVAAMDEQKKAAAAGEVDSNGKDIPALTADQLGNRAILSRQLPKLHQEEIESGPQYTEQLERLKKQRDQLQKDMGADLEKAQNQSYELAPGQTQAQASSLASDAITQKYSFQLDAIDSLISAFTKTQEGQVSTAKALETAAKTYEEAQKAKAEIDTKITAAKTDVETAKVNVDATTDNNSAKLQKDTNDQVSEQTKVDRENRDKELEAQIKTLQGQLAAATDAQRPLIQEGIERLQEKQASNKRDDANAGSTSDPKSTQANNDIYAGDVADDRGKAAALSNRADVKNNKTQIEQITSQVQEAARELSESGNKDGARALTEALRKVTDHFKGLTDQASQTLEIAQLLTVESQKAEGFRVQTKQEIKDLKQHLHRSDHL